MDGITSNPFAFGKVAVTTPGTTVALNSNFTTTDLKFHKATICAGPANTGLVYIGTKTMVRATLVGVFRILAKGEVWEPDYVPGMNGLNLANMYVDADTGGDYVYGAIVQV